MSDTNRHEPDDEPERAQRPPRRARRAWVIAGEDLALRYSKASADEAAEKLAQENPGRTFYVLRLSRENLNGAASSAAKLSDAPSIRAVRVDP